MAGVGGKNATRAPTTAYIRMAVLSALLMLSVYTVFALLRLQHEARAPMAAPAAGAAETQALAAHAEADVARLDAALTAGGAVAARFPTNPMDAAEAALTAARPAATAVAVIGDDGSARAIAGQAPDADWTAAAAAASAVGRGFWPDGRPRPRPASFYVARSLSTPTGRVLVVALADLSHDLSASDAGSDGALAGLLVTPDGQIAAASGYNGGGGAAQASTLKEALGVDPGDIQSKSSLLGELPDGTTVLLAVRPIADGALFAIVALPHLKTSAHPAQTLVAGDLFALLAPLLVGCLLAWLLLIQIRKAEVAQKVHEETERRFRLAVEAARCGIWEW